MLVSSCFSTLPITVMKSTVFFCRGEQMEDCYKFVVSIMCMWGDSTIALLWVEGQTNARSVYLGQMGLWQHQSFVWGGGTLAAGQITGEGS